MRLKSEFWVQAFLRTNEQSGRSGAVLRKGAPEAGAVFVVINHLNGTSTLLGPAPGPAYDEQGDRRFLRETPHPVEWHDVRLKLERKANQDSDIWVVEVDDRSGLGGLQPESS
jgi:hypothetical protein